MRDVVAFLSLVLAGPGFLLLGIRNLRRGAWRDGVPVAELLVYRALEGEPRPRTRWDRRFAFCQAVMMILFGLFFSLALLAIVLTLFIPE
jgi:hypothetical protein